MEGHCTSERPPFLRRQPVLPRASPALSLREVACACSALARLCARSLWGRGPARALPTRARRAKLATLGPCTMEGHCTSEKPPFLRRQARAPTCQPCPSLREVACACSALARLCARSLWGRGPARALPTRARRAALATLAPRTMEGHCTSERPPFLRRQPVLPRASPAPHCARWLARVARLRASALALSGDEAQHVRFRRARAPRRAGDTRSMHYGRALHEREAAVPSAPGPCSHVPALPLTAHKPPAGTTPVHRPGQPARTGRRSSLAARRSPIADRPSSSVSFVRSGRGRGWIAPVVVCACVYTT